MTDLQEEKKKRLRETKEKKKRLRWRRSRRVRLHWRSLTSLEEVAGEAQPEVAEEKKKKKKKKKTKGKKVGEAESSHHRKEKKNREKKDDVEDEKATKERKKKEKEEKRMHRREERRLRKEEEARQRAASPEKDGESTSVRECPSIIVPQVVRSFYRGRLHGNRDAVTFKGETVSFNAKDINEIYQMKDDPDASRNKIIDDPTEEQMEDAMRVLTQPGMKWSISLKDIHTLESKSLLLEGRL
ncbi:protein PXR1-like [Benincasa hispida]|uniref:protein PXR1-like n=1 Tax=Benincasa hispida TaxID=102211 RepID=UPI0018FF6CEA|nr:protein PXR1-like [Benincasa hispida]